MCVTHLALWARYCISSILQTVKQSWREVGNLSKVEQLIMSYQNWIVSGSAISILGIYSADLLVHSQNNTCTRLFTEALFIVAKG